MFRDLCSPIGPSRLYEGLESALDLQRTWCPGSEARDMDFVLCRDLSENDKKGASNLSQSGILTLLEMRDKSTCRECRISLSGYPQILLAWRIGQYGISWGVRR